MADTEPITKNPAVAATPPPPPRAPRPLSKSVLCHSWLEPRVRFWWLFAAFVFATAIFYVVSAIVIWRADKQLIENGTLVNAMVGGIAGQNRPPEIPFDLTFTLNGQTYQVNGVLEGRKDFVTQGQTVPIRVDPNDPTRWTYRSEVEPLSSEMVGSALAAALGCILMTVSWLQRRQVLRIYQYGEAILVQVISLSNSALAPRCRSARFARVDLNQKDVHTVTLPPPEAKAAKPGQILWVYALKGKMNRALSARVFDSN